MLEQRKLNEPTLLTRRTLAPAMKFYCSVRVHSLFEEPPSLWIVSKPCAEKYGYSNVLRENVGCNERHVHLSFSLKRK